MSVITQRLGRFRVLRLSDAVRGEPTKNSSRWVADIYQNSAVLPFGLVLSYSSKTAPSIFSFSIGPLDAAVWAARPFLEETGPLLFAIHADEPCRYRLTIDTVHSLAR